MHWKPATVAAIKSINSGTPLEHKEAQRQIRMAAATRINSNDENTDTSGGSGTRGANNTSASNNNNNNHYNNNNNNDDSTTSQNLSAAPMDEAEIKLKRQALEQRKQELERVLSEKNWLLQQIQKQETQIINGNYEYVNVNEIFAMLARQYKKEYGGGGGGGSAGGGGSVGGGYCGSGLSDVGSTAILRRKTISGTSYKENQMNSTNNNNNTNSNRQSEISNRSSEYDNYPGGNVSIVDGNVTTLSGGGGGGAAPQQQQLQKSQSLKKRSASTVTSASATAMSNYNYLQAAQQQHQRQQHHQQQQQLLQQQMLQNHMQYNALVQHQHYHQQQQQQLNMQQQAFEGQQQLMQQQQHQLQQQQQLLQQQQQFNAQQKQLQQQQQQQHQNQQQLHQQQQQQKYQQLKQQHSPSHAHAHAQSRHYPADAISLYSVNSANVATLRQQHISPQQQPIVVQCDRYYLSPTHQSYSDGGFIKSSQNIKKYISPQASPTQHQNTQQQQHQHHIQQRAHTYQQDLLMPTAVGLTVEKYQLQHQQQPQQFYALTPLPPQILLHSPQQHTTTSSINRQLDAISLAPSYVSVDVDNSSSSSAAHNSRWRSQGTLPPISPLTSPQQHHSHDAYNSTTQMSTDNKSHSTDMLSSNAYYNTSAALPSAAIKSLTKPLDEISISSLNSETQTKTKPPKAKQWMESSLDGPVMRPTSASTGSGSKANTHAQEQTYSGGSGTSMRLGANKTSAAGGSGTIAGSGSGGIATVSGVVGIVVAAAPTAAPRERSKLSSQSMSGGGATRHYSMSAASHKHPYAQAKMLQDDDGRYAKLSQSTSYLNSQRESPSISAAYPLDCGSSNTTIELSTPASKYLPPKPSNASSATIASQLTPPPPPRPPPMGEKVGVGIAGAAAVQSALSPTDIRIESPKNITIVKPATFRPYQEETKPFEMSDFYKYSTKFRQKDTQPAPANVEH